MKNSFIGLLALIAIACGNGNQNDPANKESSDLTTLYLIRHAEKQSGSDPHLTEKGQRRAEQWVDYFFLKDVDHVLSSDFNRTRATAKPLAKSKKIDTEIYDVNSLTGEQLYEDFKGKTVVLYGHSNTIGKYANDLQIDKKFKDLDENDYDHFYIVRIDKNGNAHASKEETDFMEF